MAGFFDMRLGDVLSFVWGLFWRGFLWNVVYFAAVYFLGLEDNWHLFWLCILTSAAQGVLWTPKNHAN